MQKKTNYRSARMADKLLRELAKLLQSSINDPRAQGVTLIDVEMNKDYSLAKVFFSVLNTAEVPDATKGLKSAVGFLRRELAKIPEFHDLRKLPELHFVYDTSVSQGQRIAALLAQDDIPLADDWPSKPDKKSEE